MAEVQRVGDEGSPGPEPAWVVPAAEGYVAVAEDRLGIGAQIGRGVAAADVADRGDPPVAPEVADVSLAVTMAGTVVLVDGARAGEEEVGAGDEVSGVVDELPLRDHLHVDGDVKEPQDRLPR